MSKARAEIEADTPAEGHREDATAVLKTPGQQAAPQRQPALVVKGCRGRLGGSAFLTLLVPAGTVEQARSLGAGR